MRYQHLILKLDKENRRSENECFTVKAGSLNYLVKKQAVRSKIEWR